jgi:seryl-tRNA synthetase
MLEIHRLKENRSEIINRLKIKNFKAEEIINNILALDKRRRTLKQKLDQTQAESNKLAKQIGILYKSGKAEEASKLKDRTSEIKMDIKDIQDELEPIASELHDLIVQLPNLPHISVPPGKSDEDNELVYEWGHLPVLEDEAKPHWELAKQYDIIDFDLGSKITGAGFPFYKGKGAKLQRALINFFLDEAIDAGYTEYQPPLLVNKDSGYGTGQLPDKDGQMYHIGEDDLYLIPTAEVPITNIYRDVILKPQDFPIKNVAFSSCFRREAGSYGKDVRGLNRLHQFDKVEIVQIQHPDNSYQTLEEMKEHVEGILKKLELPFRILRLCGGDLSFTSALTYDFEVFSAAQKKWLEVSSVSNFESFQANRMKLRFKENGKSVFAHTLNGSAIALPRVVAALLENNQTKNGIRIPESLVQYTGFEYINH